MSRRRSFRFTLIVAAAAALMLGLSRIAAQTPPAGDHTAHLKAWDAHKALTQSSPYRAMTWSYLGPTNISGRDFIVHPRDKMLVIGTHGRGVWAIDVSQLRGR